MHVQSRTGRYVESQFNNCGRTCIRARALTGVRQRFSAIREDQTSTGASRKDYRWKGLRENKQLVPAILCLSSCVEVEGKAEERERERERKGKSKRAKPRERKIEKGRRLPGERRVCIVPCVGKIVNEGDQRSPNVGKLARTSARKNCERTRGKRVEVVLRLTQEVPGTLHQRLFLRVPLPIRPGYTH